ncbi:RNA-binding 5-like [Brachionus plicatilis]|uniref:RNA-binding 5-like n=1 Tax=Brachionus plicatilis TaxID=10195 RepID=A0A3M7T2N2_BRAPC|nr:RNA-binding 5-like [Brachionus plicatilis]
MDYKKSKFRSDRIQSGRYRDDDDDDEYYRKKRSRSRSRSRGRNSSFSDKKKTKSSSLQQQSQSNKYEENPNNPFGTSPTVEKRFGNVTPSKTLMMRQIPPQMDDNELRTELFKMAVPYKDVRLVKDRSTGLNRGFAFIEFASVDDASGWMHSTKGSVFFNNYDARAVIFFSNTADDEAYRNKLNKEDATEWDCSKCGVRNFKRRERCFKCSISREESDKRKGGEGYDYTGTEPCNTLLLRGLDALTSKEAILDSLNKLTNFTLAIKNVHIARDSLSNVVMGFAFVELNTIQVVFLSLKFNKKVCQSLKMLHFMFRSLELDLKLKFAILFYIFFSRKTLVCYMMTLEIIFVLNEKIQVESGYKELHDINCRGTDRPKNRF